MHQTTTNAYSASASIGSCNESHNHRDPFCFREHRVLLCSKHPPRPILLPRTSGPIVAQTTTKVQSASANIGSCNESHNHRDPFCFREHRVLLCSKHPPRPILL